MSLTNHFICRILRRKTLRMTAKSVPYGIKYVHNAKIIRSFSRLNIFICYTKQNRSRLKSFKRNGHCMNKNSRLFIEMHCLSNAVQFISIQYNTVLLHIVCLPTYFFVSFFFYFICEMSMTYSNMKWAALKLKEKL